MFRKFLVKKDERAVLLYRGDFAGILGPGEHQYFDPLHRYTVEVFPLKVSRFEHRFADYILKAEPQLAAEHFHVIELGPTQVALRYENDVLVELIAPNARRLYFKGYTEIRHEVVDIADGFEVPAHVERLLVFGGRTGKSVAGVGTDSVFAVPVPEHAVGLLYVDGKLDRELEPGLHVFFRFNRDLKSELVDLRLQAIEVSGQEILTKDKVALRVN